MSAPVRLVTIGASHYCEKARWALERADIPFQEESHAPLFHWPAVRRAGGARTVPVLVADGRALGDSTDILRWIQDQPAAAWRPYPDAGRDEVEALEDQLDEVLGPHARRLAYYHLMPHRELLLASLLPTVGRGEALGFRALRRPIVALMRRSMRIDDRGAERSRDKLAALFADLDARLSEGRHWLAGDAFTAADLTLAALGAVLVFPEGYGAPLPGWDTLPDALRDEVSRWRETPTGRHILRLYAEERRRA